MAEQQSPNFNPTEPGYTPNSGNTNSGNDAHPTQNTPTPIPTPTTEPIPNDIIDTIEDIDGDGYVESVRTDIQSGREKLYGHSLEYG